MQHRLELKVDAMFTKALDLQGAAGIPFNFLKALVLADGTGANQGDLIWHDQRTIGASSNEDLDLRGGLTDAFGATLQFVRVKGFLVYAALANANNVHVGGAAATQFVGWVANSSDIVVVRPGGLFCIAALDATAYPAGAGTTDLLRIANSGAGTSVVYDIMVWGASA
ncbi:MAG TPA: hypothetical protein VKA83_09395 [Methylomirabilota bacterium]|nr:hypothetical protein [Methylomirabilota bacterium]